MNRLAGYGGGDTIGAWQPAGEYLDDNQYIGVNLGGLKTISGIVLQGREDHSVWVTEFKVAYQECCMGGGAGCQPGRRYGTFVLFSLYHKVILCMFVWASVQLLP